jgi:hypothetical protein
MANIRLNDRAVQGVLQAFSRRFPGETLGWGAVNEICCSLHNFRPHLFWKVGADSNTSSFYQYRPPRTLSGAVLFWYIRDRCFEIDSFSFCPSLEFVSESRFVVGSKYLDFDFELTLNIRRKFFENVEEYSLRFFRINIYPIHPRFIIEEVGYISVAIKSFVEIDHILIDPIKRFICFR